jgi:hypothetical protein
MNLCLIYWLLKVVRLSPNVLSILPPGFCGVRVAHRFSFLCVVFLLCLYLVYSMLPVPLDCPFMIVPSVASNVYLLGITRFATNPEVNQGAREG